MTFWQKAFFFTLALLLLAFNILGYILLDRSYMLNRGNAIQAAQTEYQVIKHSISEQLLYITTIYDELTADNLSGIVSPYASYYSQQGGYLALLQDGIEVFNSHPFFIPSVKQDEESLLYETQGYLICVIEDEISPQFAGMHLIYMKDVTSLLEYRNEMVGIFIWLSVIISLVMAAVMLFLLLRLTKPFRKLGAAAVLISQGEYGNRVHVRGKDEIGQFAQTFNLMAEKVEEHIDAITQMSEGRERFINDLAHEMRTPMTAIIGYAELLKIGNISDEEREKAIDRVISQSRRIYDMTSKLAELAFMSHGSIEKTPVGIAAVIESAAAACMMHIEEKQIVLNKEIPDMIIMGDALLLESLMQNLIENAVKYSAAGSMVDVTATTDGESIVVTVSDNGIGMDARELSKIKEPFYRVDKSRSRAEGGVGLGLALCARICCLHDACFDIESEPGAGTKAIVRFNTGSLNNFTTP